jgi:hypothetical protein
LKKVILLVEMKAAQKAKMLVVSLVGMKASYWVAVKVGTLVVD